MDRIQQEARNPAIYGSSSAGMPVIGASDRIGRAAMRIATVAKLAGAVFAALCCISAAQAQGVPPGSYRQSCTDSHIERGALVATCRGQHGRMTRSSLADVGRCTGDIGNNNGVLQCNYATGPARGGRGGLAGLWTSGAWVCPAAPWRASSWVCTAGSRVRSARRLRRAPLRRGSARALLPLAPGGRAPARPHGRGLRPIRAPPDRGPAA